MKLKTEKQKIKKSIKPKDLSLKKRLIKLINLQQTEQGGRYKSLIQGKKHEIHYRSFSHYKQNYAHN